MTDTYPGGAVLMTRAREALRGKWGLAVGTFAVYLLITIFIESLEGVGVIAPFILSGPFMLGIAIFTLAIARGKDARLEQIFEGFRTFGKSLATYLLVLLFTFLWFLLLIVPGIIAAISYSQAFYILADDATIGAREAIKKSKAMMQGYKWRYFCLQLRFIGWALLAIISLGIGFLWLFPYIQVTMAEFYKELAARSPEPETVISYETV